MKIVAIDTSASYACAALVEDGRLLHEVTDLSGHAHSSTLLPMIERMLTLHALKPRDVDLYVCAIGPGSYTGLRIGVATVKGLTAGTKIPAAGVSSLEALAVNCRFFEGVICPVIDARRDQMYSALFSCHDGVLTRLTDDAIMPLTELDKLLKKTGRVTLPVGDGYEKTAAKLTYGKLKPLPREYRNARAYGTALLGYERYLADPSFAGDGSALLPRYIKITQAEEERTRSLDAAGDGLSGGGRKKQ